MRGKSVGLLVLALGCGLVASIGITRVMADRDADKPQPSGETETIFVAIEDIPSAEIVKPHMVRLEKWPKDTTPPMALTKIEDIEDRAAKGTIYAGEPILDNKLFAKGESTAGVDIFIPPGHRVVPVKVDSVSGGANMVRPGSRVDVILFIAACPAKGIAQTIVKTILQDIKVFAVNDVAEATTSDEEGAKSIKATTISLLLTLEQTQQVVMASELGKLRLVMRGRSEDTIEEVAETTSQDMLDEGEGDREGESLIPEMQLPNQVAQSGGKSPGGGIMDLLNNAMKSTAPAPSATPGAALQVPEGATAPEQHQMRLMIGPEVRHVTLQQSQNGDGPRRWRVSEGGLGNAGFAMAGDMPPVVSATPPSESPEEADPPEENAEDEPPPDDE